MLLRWWVHTQGMGQACLLLQDPGSSKPGLLAQPSYNIMLLARRAFLRKPSHALSPARRCIGVSRVVAMGTTSHGEKKVLVPIADGSEEMEAGKGVLLASPAGCRLQWHVD